MLIDSRAEAIAAREAHQLKIPVISLSGTDCDISKIDYPVIGNDGSGASIKRILHQIKAAYTAGLIPLAVPEVAIAAEPILV